jgi:hypothetical protein
MSSLIVADKPTTKTIIDMLTSDGMSETDVTFFPAIEVMTSNNYHLMNIYAVCIDAGGKLWVKNTRTNWIELTDNLIYLDNILDPLYKRLNILHPAK